MARRPVHHDDPTGLAALTQSWARVRANGGVCGADAVGIEAFDQGVEQRLRRLAEDLAARRYRPGPVRIAAIPKSDGGRRLLSIPTVRDRVVQGAVALWLSAQLDETFCDGSFAYRPGRSVEMALAALGRAWRAGDRWTLDADITRFFDRIPHGRLRREVRRRLPRARHVRALIDLWLPGFGRFGRGLAQGSPVSPVLANLYLDPVDRAFAACDMAMIRYADDFVVAAADEAEALAARALAGDLLRARGLRLNPDKTFVRRPGERFVFLGREVAAPCA